MREPRTSLGWGALALIPIACCIGIPLIAAAGISVAVSAWVGGIAIGALILAAATALLVIRGRRRRACATPAITNVPRRT